MQFRDYQFRTIVDACSTSDRVCVAAPTGAGKTAIGSGCAARFSSVCWVAPRIELVEQSRAALKLWAPNTRRSVITIQSISKPSAHHYDLLVLDECHHFSSDEWSLITTNVQHDKLIGLTATPYRGDGRALTGQFDRIVVAATYSELLDRKLLVPCRITSGPEDREGIAANPLKAWKEHGEDALTIAFAPSIPLAEKWSAEFNAAGIPSTCVTGKSADRTDLIDSFRSGRTKVIWNYAILTEGFDVPEVACILLARKCGTAGIYLQIVGRGLRVASGKTHCRLLDLAGNYRIHGLPTEDREYSLEGKAIRRCKVQRLRQCLACGAVCVAWVGECPECGFVTPRRNLPVKVHNEQLLEVFDGENTPEDAKQTTLQLMRDEYRKAGRSVIQLANDYKAQFGARPKIRDLDQMEKAFLWRVYSGKFGPTMQAKIVYKAFTGEWPSRY